MNFFYLAGTSDSTKDECVNRVQNEQKTTPETAEGACDLMMKMKANRIPFVIVSVALISILLFLLMRKKA